MHRHGPPILNHLNDLGGKPAVFKFSLLWAKPREITSVWQRGISRLVPEKVGPCEPEVATPGRKAVVQSPLSLTLIEPNAGYQAQRGERVQ